MTEPCTPLTRREEALLAGWNAERDQLRSILGELVALHDEPHGDHHYVRDKAAWQEARAVVNALSEKQA